MRKNLVILSLLVAFSIILSACGSLPGAGAEPKILQVNTGGVGDIPTIDPAVAEDTTSITIVESTFIGLTNIHEETSALEPGIATSWDEVTNSDGTQTITFHLRDDISWVKWDESKVVKVEACDGSDRVVTAGDFAYGIQRNLDPVNASPYGYLLAAVLKGAATFNNGEATDFSTVGVEVVDDVTLNLTFNAPAAYNAQIAGLWVARPQPKWVIEGDDCNDAAGEGWTEPGVFQSYGPYTMKEWVHDSSFVMVKNPFWPAMDNIPQAKIDEIHFVMLDEGPAFAEYEAGNLDWVTAPLSDIDRIKSDPVLSKEFNISPSTCSYFYGFNTTAPHVDDARVRRALSMAVDRQSLIDNVTKGGQLPAQWFVTPGLAGAPTLDTHPDLGIKYDPEGAKAELQSYLDEKGLTVEELDLALMFNTSSAHQAIAEAIQQMWADVLGVNVNVVNQEWAVYLETIKGLDTPQIWRLGWCQDYPDANNYDKEVFASNGSSNPTDADGNPAGGVMWKNEEYESLVAEAAIESDPAKRLEMYAQAEEILVKTDAVIIPIYWYTNVSVTKPYVTRTFAVGGHQIYYKWDVNRPAQ
jgi:oligopeptide transport system substrate-binding protein